MASRFRDKWQLWDGKRKICFSPSRIVTFLPVQTKIWSGGAKIPQVQFFFRARERHILPRNVTNVTRYILSPKKVTNVMSLTQIWDGKLGRNLVKTDPKFSPVKSLWFSKLFLGILLSEFRCQVTVFFPSGIIMNSPPSVFSNRKRKSPQRAVTWVDEALM